MNNESKMWHLFIKWLTSKDARLWDLFFPHVPLHADVLRNTYLTKPGAAGFNHGEEAMGIVIILGKVKLDFAIKENLLAIQARLQLASKIQDQDLTKRALNEIHQLINNKSFFNKTLGQGTGDIMMKDYNTLLAIRLYGMAYSMEAENLKSEILKLADKTMMFCGSRTAFYEGIMNDRDRLAMLFDALDNWIGHLRHSDVLNDYEHFLSNSFKSIGEISFVYSSNKKALPVMHNFLLNVEDDFCGTPYPGMFPPKRFIEFFGENIFRYINAKVLYKSLDLFNDPKMKNSIEQTINKQFENLK